MNGYAVLEMGKYGTLDLDVHYQCEISFTREDIRILFCNKPLYIDGLRFSGMEAETMSFSGFAVSTRSDGNYVAHTFGGGEVTFNITITPERQVVSLSFKEV